MKDRALRWVLFGAAISTAPVAAAALTRWLLDPGGVGDLMQRGDLLLVSAVLGLTALGELVGSRAAKSSAAIVAGGMVAFCAFFAALLYPALSVVADSRTLVGLKTSPPNAWIVLAVSAVVFLGTVGSGYQCLALLPEEGARA